MIAVCIGCGCRDDLACWDTSEEQPCHWERVDRETGLGVCSCCDPHIARWDNGDRSLSDEAKAQ